ncbi:MAG: PAS domain-containing sensor histidine kinase [Chloroflexota bacterium]
MKRKQLSLDFRVALLYLLFGGLWILLSDRLLAALVTDNSLLTQLQTYKGWAFVAISALVIFLLLRHELNLRGMAEANLRESEERFRLLFENNHDVMLLTNPLTGEIRNANRAAEEFYGYPLSTLRRMNMADINQLSRDEFEKERMRAAGEQRNRFIFRHRLASGEIRIVEVYSTPIVQGTETLLFSIVHDITERKRAEEELRLSRERLAELSRQLIEAQETERRAIGRELHDQFGQMLTALKLTLDIAAYLPPELAEKKLTAAQKMADDLIARTSRISLDLRPPMLDDLGLVPALLWHVNRFEEQSGIRVNFAHYGVQERRFAPEIETTAYRAVQEALTNAARHAGATQIRLEVRVRDGEMDIEIEDDGRGFDPHEALAQNHGLGAMRERVHLAGGSFHVQSRSGEGARLSIRLPLRETTT